MSRMKRKILYALCVRRWRCQRSAYGNNALKIEWNIFDVKMETKHLQGISIINFFEYKIKWKWMIFLGNGFKLLHVVYMLNIYSFFLSCFPSVLISQRTCGISNALKNSFQPFFNHFLLRFSRHFWVFMTQKHSNTRFMIPFGKLKITQHE